MYLLVLDAFHCMQLNAKFDVNTSVRISFSCAQTMKFRAGLSGTQHHVELDESRLNLTESTETLGGIC